MQETQVDPWVEKIPWRRKCQPTPVFLPREYHGQRSLVGYRPWGHEESDITEWLNTISIIKNGEKIFLNSTNLLFLRNVKNMSAAAKSLQSCPTLCDPIDSSPPGSPIPGILQARTLGGLPFPSPMREGEKRKWSRSVVSDSLWPHGLQPIRLLHPWDFPGKSTGVGCHLSSYFFLVSMLVFKPSLR